MATNDTLGNTEITFDQERKMHSILDEHLNLMNSNRQSSASPTKQPYVYKSYESADIQIPTAGMYQDKLSRLRNEQSSNQSIKQSSVVAYPSQYKHTPEYKENTNKTPDSLKDQTSQFLVDSNTKNPLRDSSLRNILDQSDHVRRQSQSSDIENRTDSSRVQGSSKKADLKSYTKMSTNLKDLQQKINDLENKLGKVGASPSRDNEDILPKKNHSIIKKDEYRTVNNSLRQSKIGIKTPKKQSLSKKRSSVGNTSQQSNKSLSRSRQANKSNHALRGVRETSLNERSTSLARSRLREHSFSESNKKMQDSNKKAYEIDDVKKLRELLCKERKKNYEMQRVVDQQKNGTKGKEMSDKKYRLLKADYSQLLQAFEKSEHIRREQKDLILSLKRENAKMRKQQQSMSTQQESEEETEPVRQKAKKGKKTRMM